MAERVKNMRQLLLHAGIAEINEQGVTGFSIRRVATACGVSCAAPYKHFKDKREFISAIIDYVNEQWSVRQEQVLAACGDSLRQQLVEVSVEYVKFLMEMPYYRSILMLKDAEFDNLYHRKRGQTSSRTQELERAYQAQSGLEEAVWRRKVQLVRSVIYGTVFLLDAGELEYTAETIQNLRHHIEREFDLP